MKLSKTQQELLYAMRQGVVVVCRGTEHPYCVRTDTNKKVTAAVNGLIKKRIAKTKFVGIEGDTQVVLTTV